MIDDADAETVGTWQKSTHDPRHIGAHYLHDQNNGKGEKSITYPLNLDKTGRYEVLVSYSAGSSRAAEVPITVRHADGVATITLDQRPDQPVAEQWASIGEYTFDAIRRGSITILEPWYHRLRHCGTRCGWWPVDANRNRPSQADSALEQQIEAARQEVMATRGRVKGLQTEIDGWKKTAPPPLPVAMAVHEQPAEQRGDWHNLHPGRPAQSRPCRAARIPRSGQHSDAAKGRPQRKRTPGSWRPGWRVMKTRWLPVSMQIASGNI